MNSCEDCGKELVPATTWNAATPQQRAEWIAAGRVRHNAYGLCGTCYTKRWRHSALPGQAAAQPLFSSPRPCCRCGLSSWVQLCPDCRDVAITLDELEVWTERAAS